VARGGPTPRRRADEVVRGARTGREAWVRLANAGLLPAGWLREGAREFYGRGGSCHAPDSVADAVRFAEDPAGMARAERLARALARELGAAGAPTVVWKLAPRPRYGAGVSPAAARRLEAISALGYGVEAIHGRNPCLIVLTAPRRTR
jgi:hypothetical protein